MTPSLPNGVQTTSLSPTQGPMATPLPSQPGVTVAKGEVSSLGLLMAGGAAFVLITFAVLLIFGFLVGLAFAASRSLVAGAKTSAVNRAGGWRRKVEQSGGGAE